VVAIQEPSHLEQESSTQEIAQVVGVHDGLHPIEDGHRAVRRIVDSGTSCRQVPKDGG
jgi:hypothetical protein